VFFQVSIEKRHDAGTIVGLVRLLKQYAALVARERIDLVEPVEEALILVQLAPSRNLLVKHGQYCLLVALCDSLRNVRRDLRHLIDTLRDRSDTTLDFSRHELCRFFAHHSPHDIDQVSSEFANLFVFNELHRLRRRTRSRRFISGRRPPLSAKRSEEILRCRELVTELANRLVLVANL